MITRAATPVALKLWRSMLESKAPPDCLASRVMMPGERGVTVKTPAAGPLIEAVPVELDTTVSASTRPELADGVTVNEPATIARSAIAAKLID